MNGGDPVSGGRRLRLLVLTSLYPNNVEPSRALFNARNCAALAGLAEVVVVAPVPWCPGILAWSRRWGRYARVRRFETVNGVRVHRPRYLMIPVLGRFFQAVLYRMGVDRTVARLCRDTPFDALVALWAYPDAVAAASMARRHRLPGFALFLGSDVNVLMQRTGTRRAVKRAIHRLQRTVCVSEALQSRLLAMGVAHHETEVVRNGVDGSMFRVRDRAGCRARLGVPAGRAVVLFVGNLVETKGADLLPEVLGRLGAGTVEPPFMVIVGDGPLLAKLQRDVREKKLIDHVLFAGRRDGDEVPLWLGAADVVLVPSRTEGCPNVVLEALASGRPVVAAAAGGIPEIVVDGDQGRLFPPGDAGAMVAAVREVLERQWDPGRVRDAGPRRGWDTCARELEGVIRRDCEMSSRGRTVLHVLNISLPRTTGYALRSRALVACQKEMNLRPVVVTSHRQGPCETERERREGVTYYRASVGSGPLPRTGVSPAVVLALWRLYRLLVRVCKQENAAIIHAHSPVLCALPAWAAARRTGLPFVYEVRALWEDAAVSSGKTRPGSLRYRTTRVLESLVLRRADRVVVICKGLAREVADRGIGRSRVDVVPNGVDTGRFKAGRTSKRVAARHGLKDRFVVGFLGSVFRFEGLDTLLDSVPELMDRGLGFRILVAGTGEYLPVLQDRVRREGLADWVAFAGQVPHGRVAAYYSTMDVVVYPRFSERITEITTPLKPLEAMALSRPVVVSDVGGLTELVADGETGLVFRAGDPGDLAEKIMAMTDAETAAAIARNARRAVARDREWSGLVARYRDTYWKAGTARRL